MTDAAEAARFRRIARSFEGALARPRDEREAWLVANEPDAALREEVRDLLATDARADGAIERTLEAAAKEAVRAHGSPHAFGDDTIDGWHLQRRLGEGGMGAVHLARPATGEGPPVAIKLLRDGVDAALLADRFETERRILATLSHPGIARLLGAGRSRDGRPYLVLEYVEGEPIDAYCARARLDVRERVALVARVCEAVHDAHRNLVVHRDLKPGNVLVTADGAPKLLDFGIAKLLGDDVGAVAAIGTVTRLGWMTPAYASPEQILGEPARPASDVHALGVLLHELLVGVSPHGEEAASNPAKLAQAIVERTPMRASARVLADAAMPAAQARAAQRRTVPSALARTLSGDLDRILEKTLEKAPDRRYDSAGALGDDLDRWLRGLPVSARPATFRYRAGKFLRRHRLAAALVAMLLVGAIGFVATVLVLLAQARVERDRAERTTALLTDLFEVAEPGPDAGRSITAQALLDRGAERAAVRLEGDPDAHARFLATLGRLYAQLGLYDRAAASVDRALRLRHALDEGPTPTSADLLDQLARIRAAAGEFRAAEPLFRQALAQRRALLPRDDPRIADSVNNLALVLHDLGRYAQAEPLYRELVEARGGENDVGAVTRGNLALLYADLGRLEESEALFREVLAIRQDAFGAESEDVADAYDDLGMVETLRGSAMRGRADLLRGLALRRRLLGEDHRDVARSLEHLATAEQALGDPALAERLARDALAMRVRLLGPEHAETAGSHLALGLILLERHALDDAGRELHRAQALHAASLGADHPLQGPPLHALARWALATGDCVAATDYARRALARLPARDRRRPELERVIAGCAR